MPEPVMILRTGTLVPKEDAEWFDKQYPMKGAWSHFIRESLARFRELHREATSMDDLIALGQHELMSSLTESKHP